MNIVLRLIAIASAYWFASELVVSFRAAIVNRREGHERALAALAKMRD